jgi:FMN phosphatase YigB (HAD superfamily)
MSEQVPVDLEHENPHVGDKATDIPYEEKERKEDFEEEGMGKGVKYDKGKPSLARLPSRATFEVGRVFEHGATKYDDTDKLNDNNWRKGMRWSRLLDASLRHIFAFKQGETMDQDSGLSHLAHAATSLLMLEELRTLYPSGDDRDHVWARDRGYVLDIDGVLADFSRAFQEKAVEMGLHDEVTEPSHWQFPFDAGAVWEDMDTEHFFLEEIDPLIRGEDLPLEPHAYLTSRPADTGTTEGWLYRHGFPNAPVYTVDEGEKAEAAHEIDMDTHKPLTFVDDSFHNFKQLNREGFHCLLFDRPMNRHFDVGQYRITDLRDLLTDEAYDQT